MIAEAGKASPHARFTGAVYLLYFIAAILGQMLVSRKLASAGEAVNLLSDALYAAVTLLLYRLLRPVSRRLSFVAALLSLAGCAVTVMEQHLQLVAMNISPLIFFGPFCILLGYLIVRSTFLPRFLGVLLMLAGVAWLIYLAPGLPNAVQTPILVLGALAEGLLMLWLVVMGVRTERWKGLAESS